MARICGPPGSVLFRRAGSTGGATGTMCGADPGALGAGHFAPSALASRTGTVHVHRHGVGSRRTMHRRLGVDGSNRLEQARGAAERPLGSADCMGQQRPALLTGVAPSTKRPFRASEVQLSVFSALSGPARRDDDEPRRGRLAPGRAGRRRAHAGRDGGHARGRGGGAGAAPPQAATRRAAEAEAHAAASLTRWYERTMLFRAEAAVLLVERGHDAASILGAA